MFILSTRSLTGYGLDKIFQIAKKAGCDGIDLSLNFSEYDTVDSEYLDTLMTRHEIRVISITAPERKMSKKQAEQILILADTLGIGIVSFFPPHRTDRDKDWFGEGLKTMVAKHPNIKINIVNAPPKTWLFVIAEYTDARPETIKKITNHTALSIENVEPESGVDLMKTFTLLGNTVELVYLSDKTEEEKRLFLGEGSMPLESLLIRMKEAGYTGIFSLDIAPEHIDAGKEDTAIVKKIESARAFLYRYYS